MLMTSISGRMLSKSCVTRAPIVSKTFGASVGGRRVGTLGAAGCFSFPPRKTLTTGEGGVIVTDDERLAERCRLIRNHGEEPVSIGEIPATDTEFTDDSAEDGVAYQYFVRSFSPAGFADSEPSAADGSVRVAAGT